MILRNKKMDKIIRKLVLEIKEHEEDKSAKQLKILVKEIITIFFMILFLGFIICIFVFK